MSAYGPPVRTGILGRMSETFIIRKLVNDDATATISDYGAHVLSYAPAGHEAVVWQPAAVYLASGCAIRGGVPIIFPWFNTGYDGGRPVNKKPKHGFARASFWKFDEANSDRARHVRYTLDSADCEPELLRTIGCPDPRFRAVYDVTVGERLTMALTVTNTGTQPLVYEAALHTYFQVGDVERTVVRGLETAGYLDNARDGVPYVEASGEAITFDGMVDRTYEADGAVRIEDAVLGRTIVVEKSGAPQTVVWNPGEAAGDAIGDMAQGEWRGFVCVEAVARLDRSIALEPGATHTLTQTVSLA
ncbi:D-hexose-6-phosphate mutarotase [Bifidobacterium eulemuris]|uniref:Putative glucose-6-phosphate 1-epimerase n=2 Tax=Bifidobacterium eulemuris TaxID=1765219 RepID=A0A261GBA5_9BIFI|nr:D-hexose-6-phosphate mutarotase [Bifidobacterium eulemuris]